ncbi:MAG: hypothetical protein JOZ99_08225 [Actinobacteria bacterium]|nr:hypothetical protein [Actinomycetota bacterium]
MARIRPPQGSAVFLDHQPAQYLAFNRLYGALWSHGVVDEPTKEAGRLRNAQLVDCGL